MDGYKVLLVEDEAIVAEDLRAMLVKLGYNPVGIADNGKDALAMVAQHSPDLVLMDIHIQGNMDGIDTAEQIAVQYDIPVTYLTAYADEKTLERAKATLPYGYILKPFEERDLRTSIEVALYKHRVQHVLEKMDNWYEDTLQHVGMSIVTVDETGKIIFMNKMAEALIGVTLMDAVGLPIDRVMGELTTDKGEADIHVAQKNSRRVRYTRSPLSGTIAAPRGHVISLEPVPA